MEPLQFVGQDQAQLTTEQFQLIQEAVITAARKPLVGRTVMPVKELNDYGIQQIKTWTQTDMSAAAIAMTPLQENADIVGLTAGTLNLPAIWKDFRIFARDLASSQRQGIPLDTAFATDAARRVAELEETLIWEGAGAAAGATQPYVGFMGVVGRQSHATLGTWATAGNAYKDFCMAVAGLETAGYAGPYAMIVSPAQKALLRTVFTNTGITELEKIQEQADVYTSFFFADDANCLVVAVDPANFELQIAQNVITRPAVLPTGDFQFRVLEALVPQFKRATSIFDITTIVLT